MENSMRNLEEYPVDVRLRIFAAQLYAGAGLGTWCFASDEMIYSTCENEKALLDFLMMSNCLDFMNQKPGGWNCPVILNDFLGMIWMGEHVYRDGKPIYFTMVGPFFLSATSVRQIEKALKERISSISMCRQMMRGEQLILQAVKDGNLNWREILEREAYYDASLLSDTGDTLRDGKNSVIIFIALCCRAAMEGGLPGKTAKELERKYTTEIENCTTMTKMKNIYYQMLDEMCRKVHGFKEEPMISKATKRACDYIRSNVKSPLTVEEIAGEVGYAPYYFNRKFYAEMGIRVGDYIKQARCEYAKVELLTTQKSIQDISDSLHFGTRNYFCKVFREVVGITPAAYRDNTANEKQ